MEQQARQEIGQLEIYQIDRCLLLAAPIQQIPSSLFPEESTRMTSWVEKRQREFSAGRALSRHAMGLLGLPMYPIPIGKMRQPLWPPGLVGSITHTDTHCAVALGRQRDALSMGIDIETEGRVTPDLWPHIFAREEIALLESQPLDRQSELAGQMFSAKEAYFKLQYPLTTLLPGFIDVTTRLDRSGSLWVCPTKKLRNPVPLCFLAQRIFCGGGCCIFLIHKGNAPLSDES